MALQIDECQPMVRKNARRRVVITAPSRILDRVDTAVTAATWTVAASSATALATLDQTANLTIAEEFRFLRRARTWVRARSWPVAAPPACITVLGEAPNDGTVSGAKPAVLSCEESRTSVGRMTFAGTCIEQFDRGESVVN